MVDTTLVIYISVFATIISLAIGWAVGRAMDLHWRTKFLRNTLKKDYGILYIFNKDNRTIKSTMINFGKDELRVGQEIWIVDNRHIYRQDKREKGFFTDENAIKFEEGVPVVYVDHDHLTPITFYPPEGTIKPIEISAWLTAFVSNQLAKRKNAAGQLQILIIVAIICALGAAAIAWMNHGDLGTLKTTCGAVANATVNATGIITQPTVHP